jgi:outer membrane lipoprotein SlyB
MKTTLFLGLSVLMAGSTLAQGLRPSVVNGALVGGVAGAVIGNNSGRGNGLRGAAIGAGTGALLGSIMSDRSDYRGNVRVGVSAAPRTYLYRDYGRWHGGGSWHGRTGYYGRGYGWGGHSGFYASYYPYYSSSIYLDRSSYDYPVYVDDYETARPNYAASGAVFGALAGAVIGNNSGDLRHNGWRGAGLGAAAGYLIGSIAENNARRREAILTAQAQQDAATTAAVSAPAEPTTRAPSVTASEPRPSTASSMSSANSLFGR